MRLLGVAFLGWIAAEVAVFLILAYFFGFAFVVLATIVTSSTGVILLCSHGTTAIRRLKEKFWIQYETSVLTKGLWRIASGILLLLPGFLSDALGILLFSRPARLGIFILLQRWLQRWLRRRLR